MKYSLVALLFGLTIGLTACSGGNTNVTESNSAVESVSNDTDKVAEDDAIEEYEIEKDVAFGDSGDSEVKDSMNIDLKSDEASEGDSDTVDIEYNSDESENLWQEYENTKNKVTDIKDYEFKGCIFNYTGDLKLDLISSKEGNVFYVRDKDGSDELTVGVYDKSINPDGWQAVIDKNHENVDANGNTYYIAEHIDGDASFIAYEDGTLIVFNYETGDIFRDMTVSKI